MTHTAEEIANYLGAEIEGDARAPISGLASPERAAVEDIVYLDSPRFEDRVAKSAARCVLAARGTRLAGKTIIEVEDPKLAFAKVGALLAPRKVPVPGIHPTAIVPPSANLGENVTVGPYVVVEERVTVGRQTVIEAFCFVGRDAQIGENCWLHPRVTLYAGARLGNRVEIHSGVVIGGDGFGFVFGEGRHWKFPQVGTLEIGDDVEIGCNSAIDRGSLETTKIGLGVKIDNLVQIAHNVQIGEHTVVAAQTGVSGSSRIGKQVLVGGQVGIADHCTVEDGAILGAQAGIPTGKTIRGGQTVWGTPARPLNRFKQQYALFARLPEFAERIREVEQRVKRIEQAEG
jgi:UDP-3-O-[3-hydroxymyristoyl] glucosamine N-acyltransferase